MRTKKNIWALLCLFLCQATLSLAQNGNAYQWDSSINRYTTPNGQPVERCASVEVHKQRMEALRKAGIKVTDEQFEAWLSGAIETQKNSRISYGVITLPVVVHVIHNNETVGTDRNISDAQILSQIEVLNEDFRKTGFGDNSDPDGADTEIEFVMAQRDPSGNATDGIVRWFWDDITGASAGPGFTVAEMESTIKPNTIWDATKYFNMWTVEFDGADATTLGYAQFPDAGLAGVSDISGGGGASDTDGLVMVYSSFGSNHTEHGGPFASLAAPYDKGRTATHEIGHGLGLRHIWGDGGGSCSIDDFCEDTPSAADPNFGCPTVNSCTDPGVDENDMVENYMDYTDDDCMNIFTEDQKARMRTVLLNSPRRATLATSSGLIPPTTNDIFMLEVLAPRIEILNGTFTPQISIKNTGSATLTSASFRTRIDGVEANTTNWTGSVASDATATVSLSSTTVALGTHTISVEVITANGITDEYAANDTVSFDFTYTTGQPLPYSETFSESTFPPTSWEIINTDADGYSWVQQSNITGSDGNTTTAAYYNLGYAGNTATDDLISSLIDLSGETSPTLNFDVAYGGASANLSVYISDDAGATWSSALFNKSGTTLRTTGTTQATTWLPTAAGNWRAESVDLSAYVGQTILIKFTGTNGSTNKSNLLIDNLDIPTSKAKIAFVSASSTATETTVSGTGCRTYQDVTISMEISNPPTGDADVTITGSGTASDPADYEILTAMPITFPDASTANQPFTVRIYDDAAIESAESIILDYSIGGTTNAEVGFTNQTHTITVTDDDEAPIAAGITTTILSQDWSSGGGTWTDDSPTANRKNIWASTATGCGALSTDVRVVANRGNTGTLGCDYIKVTGGSQIHLYTPVDATGYESMSFSFDYAISGEANADYLAAVYSTNGGTTWTEVGAKLSGTETLTNTNVALPASLNNTAFLLGIRFTEDGDNTTDNTVVPQVDNIVLTGLTIGDPIATAVSSGDAYLGPNSTVYFYNGSSELLAKIENTSSHDYGCTTVAIDRAGTGAVEFWDATAASELMSKTLTVTPTTNNTSGTYNITLYATSAEITGWETATSKANSVMKVVKHSGAISNVTAADPTGGGGTTVISASNTVATFGNDKSIEGAFATGFSGFGLGDPTSTTPTWNGTSWVPSAPTSSDNAIIGGNYNTTTHGAITCADLTVNTGNTLTVESGATVTVAGDLSNTGTILVKNEGSFVQSSATPSNSGTGTYSVERTSPDYRAHYNYYSSPIQGANQASVFGATGQRFYTLNPVTQGWVSGSSFTPAVGFIATGTSGTPTTITRTFSDNLGFNSGNINAGVTFNTGADADDDWNLIGNPYPSGLNAASFLSDNSGILGNALYLWSSDGDDFTSTAADYATMNASGVVNAGGSGIAPTSATVSSCQGFMVQALSTGNAVFSNSQRVATNNTFQKLNKDNWQRIWLGVKMNDQYSNEVLVGFMPDAKEGKDIYDATKLSGHPQLSLYTMLKSDKMAIQGLPELSGEQEVPLGLEVNSAGVFEFGINHLDNFSEFYDIYLYDALTGSSVNLRNTAYTVELAKGEYNDRFSLRFVDTKANAGNDWTDRGVSIFATGNVFKIHFANSSAAQANINIYDLAGHQIFAQSVVNKLRVEVQGQHKGIFIVRVENENGVSIKRLYLE